MRSAKVCGILRTAGFQHVRDLVGGILTWSDRWTPACRRINIESGALVATTTGLMTVEQYRELPETGPFYYELHGGELLTVSRPKLKHIRIQRRIRQMLDAAFGLRGIVETELPFRALPEYELRVADVAFVTHERWGKAGDDDLFGAPDLTIEVLSPSNTASEINEKAALCLANGCREFWIVDSRLRQIAVSTPDGITRTYRSGESIRLVFADNLTLPVDSVFEDE
jgi:Uma2 family endonuclease